MLSSMFDSSTVPVLEQVVKFTQARHGVLAGNIANMDTPGYQTRDLSPVEFQEKLKEAIEARSESAVSPTYAMEAHLQGIDRSGGQSGIEGVSDSVKGILFHDGNDVSMERQVTEIAKNQAQHNLALSIMTAQFRLLRAAITERA